MFLKLLLLLTLIPIGEIYFLLRLSDIIGGSKTFLIILVTGFVGAWLLKRQGASILQQIQTNASQNQIPTDALTKGLFVFLGGVFLLTPGLITDALGLSLILPLTQGLWRKYFVSQWKNGVSKGGIHMYSNRSGFPGQEDFVQSKSRKIDSDVIDIKASESETISKDEL